MANAPQRWTLPDLVDFEFFLEQDRHAKASELEGRDRAIFLNEIRPELEAVRAKPSEVPRAMLFRRWLTRRRAQSAGNTLPGLWVESSQRRFAWLIVFAGLLFGSAVTGALLKYEGTEAINVSSYFWLLIVLQILLVALAVLSWLCLKMPGLRKFLPSDLSLAGQFFRWLWTRLVGIFNRQNMLQIDAARREQMQKAIGLLKSRNSVYGAALYGPGLLLVQLFGIAFNVAAIAVTLFRLASRDLAFGWQSTLSVSDQAVYTLTRWIAFPWRWLFGEGSGYPSLDQVTNSRVILKQGIGDMPMEALRAWWPFLVLSLLVYGLLPRLIFYSSSRYGMRRTMSRLRFTHADCKPLYDRLIYPVVEIEAAETTTHSKDTPRPGLPENTTPLTPVRVDDVVKTGRAPDTIPKGACVCLISEDCLEATTTESLEAHVQRVTRWQLNRTLDPEEMGEVLRELSRLDWENPPARIFWLQEAWQPMIAETRDFLKTLRLQVGREAEIIIGLIGSPQSDIIFTKVSEADLTHWRNQIDALGDPFIRLEKVIGE